MFPFQGHRLGIRDGKALDLGLQRHHDVAVVNRGFLFEEDFDLPFLDLIREAAFFVEGIYAPEENGAHPGANEIFPVRRRQGMPLGREADGPFFIVEEGTLHHVRR